MSRSAFIELDWAGDVRPFRLKMAQLERLQERCGERGPQRILFDLMGGEWKARDIVETIRLGLIGGGMKLADADKLVKEYVEEQPLADNILVAVAILQAVITGPEIPTPRGAESPSGETLTAEAGSTGLSSTETEPPSDGRQNRSVN